MNEPSLRNPAFSPLTDQQLSEIDEASDRFDQELVGGLGPRIETFLAAVPEPARDGLLAELLTIEIEFRFSRGELVTADDYLSRFPDHAELIENALDFAGNSDLPISPIGQFDQPTARIALADTSVSIVGKTPESHGAEDATSLTHQQPFGRYTLLRLLGKGGMGSVYLAHDCELDRKVAIKFPEFDDRPDVAAAAIERFRREARAMATVHHPNICPIFDVGQHDGRHYLTMAYVDGRILSDVVGLLSQTEIVRLVMTTARALHAAHQAGVVHRDLKPSNVMIDNRGEPIVMDFGLASRDAVSESGLTHSRLIIGSPAYMAPEQVDAAHARVGPRTDVYALGVILYQLLTGRRPFNGAGLAVLGQISSGNPPTPPSQISEVDGDLDAICLKAMAHQIEDRFQSAEDLAVSLDDWLKAPDAAPVEARLSRRKNSLIVGGMLVLAVSGLLMAIVNRPDSAAKPPVSPDVVSQADSGSVTVSNEDGQEPIPASEVVRDEVVLDDAVPAPLKAPFDEQQSRAGQQEWADYLGLPVEYTNSIGMKFRLIPPGEFLMGSTPEEIEAALKVAEHRDWRAYIESEGPQHRVILTRPIYVGVSEVTQSQYEQVMGFNPSCFSATGLGKDVVDNLETGNHAVESVSWFDAVDFCMKLSEQEQLKPFYLRSKEAVTSLEGTGYRLPTEAEWEFVCRAGTDTRHCLGEGDAQIGDYAWFSENSNRTTHPVCSKEANPWGLYDTHGNVWEWCEDRFGDYPSGPVTDPRSPLSGEGVVRGGSWIDTSTGCRSAYRCRLSPASKFRNCGLRVALTADAVKEP